MVEVILITIAIVSLLLAFIAGFNLKQEKKAHAETLEKSRKDGKRAGLAIAAATVQHILKNGRDLDDIEERLSEIISRWVKYDPVAYEEQKASIASLRESQKYEVSIYYRRELDEPPAREDDLSYHLERLHDMFVDTSDLEAAFAYIKTFIMNPPECEESWQKVLDEYHIPYKNLQWNAIVQLPDGQHKQAAFECVSLPFLYKNGLQCTLTIKIWYGEKENELSFGDFG